MSRHDLQRLMNCIVEQARAGEERDVERVLGALGPLAAGAGDELTFAPPRGTTPLVKRALEVMARSDRHVERARRTAS